MSTPRFGFASRGANHVSPLRGDYAMGLTMFALFEAGNQVVFTMSTPRFGFASRGANHVSPLRGGCAVG